MGAPKTADLMIYIAKAKKKTAKAKPLALGTAMSQAVKVDLTRGLTRFKQRVNPADIEHALKTGGYQAIMRTIPWEKLPEDLDPLQASLLKATRGGADAANNALPARIRSTLRYDSKNPKIATRTLTLAGTRANRAITVLQDGTLDAVRHATHRAMTEALSPKDVADSIRSSIGLNRPQAQALANYREKLRDTAMSESRRQKLADGYENRLLDQRAMLIARTEVRSAINGGQLDVWQTAMADGLLPAKSRKVWRVDGRPCDICEKMDGIAVDFDEAWTVPRPHGGTQQCMIPSDSHPNCMCQMMLDMGG